VLSSLLGLSSLNEIIKHPRNKLQSLILSNNPLFISLSSSNSSTSLSDIILSVLETQHLIDLNLSNCGLIDCQGSQYRPFLKTLQFLNLSFNKIDDNNILQLLNGCLFSFSLINLNVSGNVFGKNSRSAHSFQRLLTENQSIQYFSIRHNRLDLVIWKAILDGLKDNKVLLTLDCSSCFIQQKELLLFNQVFQQNDCCEIVLTHNPLPQAVVKDARAYFKQQASGGRGEVLLLNPLREKNSIYSAIKWRKELYQKISLSLESLYIVHIQQQQVDEEVEEGNKSLKSVTEGNSKISKDLSQSLTSYSSDDLLSTTSETQDIRNKISIERIFNKDLSSLSWKRQFIEKCEYFITSSEMNEVIADFNEKESHEERDISICLGRDSYIIGTIRLKSRHTYSDMKKMIDPIVNEYCITMDPSQKEDFLNFSIVTAQNEMIKEEALKVNISFF
jgi:hypothetical protein